jgi:hypothetical protein
MNTTTVVRAALLGAAVLGSLPTVSGPQPSQGSQTLEAALRDVSKRAETHVCAVTLLSREQVPPVERAVTKENLEEVLADLRRRLTLPARLVKLYLPPPPAGRTWRAEELLAFAQAQADLFATPIGDMRKETVQVLGKNLPVEKAKAVIEALDLRPVYVFLLERAHFGGVWDTTYGEMRLVQNGTRVSGTYTSGAGRVEGIVSGYELRFSWFEEANQSGGFGSFTLSEDGLSFSGPWYNDGSPDKPAGVWSGKRRLN